MQEKPGKVLVIDDDPDFVEFVRITLECKGHTVVAASNGPAGIEIARRERPAVVVVDLLMAPEDGFTICEELRAWPETKRSAVLVISAIGEKLHKTFASSDVGPRLEADGFLDKPVRPEVLVKSINEMLALARTRTPVSEEET